VKVAIVHDYLNDYGGAEKVVDAICELFPSAPVYTAVKDEQKLKKAGAFKNTKIISPKINGVLSPFKKFFVYSYPIYFETLDFSKYDLVLSSTAHFAKGIITGPGTLHINYMHTPTRFLWGLRTETSIRDNFLLKGPLKIADNYLRIWDYVAAQRPDYIISNSVNVQKRITKFYKRDSTVIYPFYDTHLSDNEIKRIKKHSGDYYFVISRKGKFKNLDLIAKTFKGIKKTVYIAGSGSEDSELKKYEGKYVKLLGFLTEEEKVGYLKGCKAFVLAAQDEDFGITPIEAMSFKKPVIALKSGGFTESVIEGKTGIFFEKPTQKLLAAAVEKFESKQKQFNPRTIKIQAEKFSKKRFQQEYLDFVNQKLKEYGK
jgi:glycosyltransferase involved in cell wall biosynthesis